MASTLFVDATTTVAGTPLVAAWHNDADTAVYNTLSSVAGTNTITATGPTSLTTITSGKWFKFVPAATNTGAVTINISGLGVQPITKYGANNLAAGDLVIGNEAVIVYDGSLFQLINPQVVDVAHGGTGATTASQALINLGATGRLIGVQTFTVSGTYTPTTGTTRILAEALGGGGGGGGTPATGASQVAAGGGGGPGNYLKGFYTSGFSGATVTIGAAGTAGAIGVAGGAGGTTSLGAILSATGGSGGAAGAAGALAGVGGSTSSGGSSGGNIVSAPQDQGDPGFGGFSAGFVIGGAGGNTVYGNGGRAAFALAASTNVSGAAGTGYGAGGSGSAGGQSQGGAAGGGGAAGILIIYEYS